MDAEALHRNAIIIDAVAPLLQKKKYIDDYIAGGVTCVAPTVGTRDETPQSALKTMGGWIKFIADRNDLVLIRRAADIREAKRDKKTGVLFHFQGTGPFVTDLDYVEAFRAAGLRMVMLTYNRADYVGHGCEENEDSGLTLFGRKLVERLNSNRIVVDCTHTGYKTTMDALAATSRPAVFSHSNSAVVFPNKRNIVDEQAKAAAATGGLVGITLVPQFVVPANGGAARPTLNQLLAHLDHFVQHIGIDHVGLGLDYWWGTLPFSTLEAVIAAWEQNVADGKWSREAYPKPPHYHPPELDTPDMLVGLTKGLVAKGYKGDDIRKVLGLNWLRVFEEVWGE